MKFPQSTSWGHRGSFNPAQFALLNPASYAGQQVFVDDDAVLWQFYSDGTQWNLAGTVDATPLSKFGIAANDNKDYTVQLANALDASVFENFILQAPAGNINISDQIDVAVSSGAMSFPTFQGPVVWRKPVGLKGVDALASRITQNSAGVGGIRYYPENGNIKQGVWKDITIANVNEDYSNIYQFGIQVGGGTADVVGENLTFDSVAGIGLYAVLRLDDCTGATFQGSFQHGKFKYYCEGGYNTDKFTFRNYYVSHDHPTNVACSSSTGFTISGISAAIMPYLFVGGSVVGAGIPADTVVLSKGATSIGVSNSVTAVTSFSFKLGTLLSALQLTGTAYAGSGWATIANAENYFNKTRASNPNLLTFDDIVFNRGEGMIEDYGSSYAVRMQGVYIESPKRVARFFGSGLKGLAIQTLFLSQPESIRQPAIQIDSSVPQGFIENISTDGVVGTSVTVAMPNVFSSSEWGEFRITNVIGTVTTSGGPALESTSRTVRLGTTANGNARLDYNTVTGDANFDGLGIDMVQVELTQSGRSINGPNSVQAPQGRSFEFLFIQDGTGGRTITLSAKYRKPDGTSWGLLPAGGPNTRASLRFTSLGNGLYVSDKAVLTYV